MKQDFKKIKNIARKTKCKIKIVKKYGLPFYIFKYKKRKIFAVACIVIAFLIFVISQFIWNVEIYSDNKKYNENINNFVKQCGISTGKFKKSIDIEKTINKIRLEYPQIAWVGIEIKGTNVIINIKEGVEKPNIIDRNEICNIISKDDAIIEKIVVQSGTARVKEGDEVKKGDLLVEGIMEGEYEGIRYVHSEANIIGKKYFQKERFEKYIQYEKKFTGNEETKKEIYINNFKINFNKGVSKFKNYDTICTSKKIKFFSNFYLPIIIKTNKNKEFIQNEKIYSENDLKNKIITKLEEEIELEYKLSQYIDNQKKKKIIVNKKTDGLTIKIIYEVQEEIGLKENLN